jgi:hypothetical protein
MLVQESTEQKVGGLVHGMCTGSKPYDCRIEPYWITGWISAAGQPLVKTVWMVMVLFMDTMPSLFQVSPYSDRST